MPWVMAGVQPPTWTLLSKTDKKPCGESPQAINKTGDAPGGKAFPRFFMSSCRLFYRTNLVHSLRAGCFKSAVLMGIYNEILFWQSYREIFPEKMNIEEWFSTLREELILRRMVAKYPSLSGEEIMNQFGKESMQWYIMALENKDWGKEWYLWEDCWWKIIKRVERIQKGA